MPLKKAFLPWLFLLPLLTRAQTPADVTLQLVQPDADHQFFLMSRPSGIPGKKVSHYMVVRYLRDSKEVALPLSPLDSTQNCAGWPVENVSIFFVNNQLGFLYGNTIGYGYCSFTYRTVDGGKSWTRVIVDTRNRADAAYRDALFMFNEKQGIILSHLYKGRLDYYLTADGGLSWTEKHLRISEHEPSAHAHGLSSYLQPLYSKSGSIILVTKQESSLTPTIFTVFRSEDFGQSFRTLK